MTWLELAQRAQLYSRIGPHYQLEQSTDFAAFLALVEYISEVTVAAGLAFSTTVTATANATLTFGQSITTVGLYRMDIVCLVTATTAATGIITAGVNFTDDIGAATINGADTLDLTTTDRSYNSIVFRLASSSPEVRIAISGFTTGSATVKVYATFTYLG